MSVTALVPEGGLGDTGVLLAAAISLSVVTGSLCLNCGHAWKAHPGALISITHCADCIIEEDHGDREVADMCSRIPADLEHVPVGDSLVARYKRRPLRDDRLLIEDYRGARWALLRPPAAGRRSPIADRREVERLLLQVRADLATMPITQFREKYLPLMD